MDCFDLIVVGSGPGATFAAYGARGRSILMLDAGGDAPECPELRGNAYELRQGNDDLFPSLIGERFESLHNLANPPVSLKLKSPYMSYVARDWRRATPVVSDTFEGAIGLAKGGLANAWGAGVYRFTERDLSGFPISAGDLRPYYDELTAHIGVSGANDDLAKYFEHDDGLQPPLRLSDFFAGMMRRYEPLRPLFQRERVTLGRPRLAVLTQAHNGRGAYEYGNLEFFHPRTGHLHARIHGRRNDRRDGLIDYRGGRLMTRYRDTDDGVETLTLA